MIFSRLKSGIEVTDTDFDAIYTSRIKKISKMHFTPVEVAKTAANYLVTKPGTKVLDVGSGAGKFCMVGATCTNGHFTGVEQRQSLFQLSDLLSKGHRLSNTRFLHANITEIDFCAFDAVYFFNSFYENIFPKDPIDRSVEMDKYLYTFYTEYLSQQLGKMPIGTRLATYFTYAYEVPTQYYELQSMCFDTKLKLWEKVK
jgi:SAM-dependent methyltransferase